LQLHQGQLADFDLRQPFSDPPIRLLARAARVAQQHEMIAETLG